MDNTKETAFHPAAMYDKTDVLQIIWEWSTQKMSTEEVNEFSLAKED